jgi:hypothetical protein
MRITAVVGSAICIAMLLVSCMKQATVPPGAEAAGVEGIQWYLTEVGGSPVSPMADDKQPHILLDSAKKQATGFAGCNHFFGRYELDGASLTFGPTGELPLQARLARQGSKVIQGQGAETTRVPVHRRQCPFASLDPGTCA